LPNISVYYRAGEVYF